SVVGGVEELEAELQSVRLPHAEVAAQSDVDVEGAWRAQRVPSRVAERADRIGDECGGGQPLLRVQIAHVGGADDVGAVGTDAGAGVILAGGRAERKAGAG